MRESTGTYWIPVWSVREDGLPLTLVNPATGRALQGYKTDRIDARALPSIFSMGCFALHTTRNNKLERLRITQKSRAVLKLRGMK